MFHKFARAEILGAYGQRQRTANVKLADVNNYSDYKTDDGYLYVRVRAISSRTNKNGDSWGTSELEESFKTFIGKPIYVDHNNHDPNRTRGVIVDADFHVEDLAKVSGVDPYYATSAWDHEKPPSWVEILLEVDAKSFPRLAKAIIGKDIDGVSMGCFIPGTPITLADGTQKPIETIKVGDEVLTHTGKTEPVTYVMEKPHAGVVYTIETFGQSQPMVLTSEHPVYIRRLVEERGSRRYKKADRTIYKCLCDREFTTARSLGAHLREVQRRGTEGSHAKSSQEFEGWVEAQDIKPGDYVVSPTFTETSHPGSYPFARLLGYYAAEGNLGYDKKRYPDGRPVSVEWNFHEDEIEYHEEVKYLIEALGYRSVGPYIKSSCGSIRCNSPELAARFLEYGGRYSHAKQLSTEVMNWSIPNQKALIDAYFNGDGHYEDGKPGQRARVEAASTSKKLAEQIQLIAVRCGYAMTPPVRQHSPAMVSHGHKPKYQMQTTLEDAVNPHQKGALQSAFLDDKGLWRRITNIGIRHYEGNVYNFDVDGDDSYVAANIAVHNCNVEYTLCTHCHNRAETPEQFCSHILNKGANFDYWLPNGQKTSKKSAEICKKISFFEISFVFDPADETALIRDIKQARTGSVRQAVLAESYNRHMLSDAFGDLSSSHEYLMQIGKEAWNQAILKEAPDPESNAWNAAMIAIKKAGFPQDAVEVANNIRESFTTMSDQLNAQVDPETRGYDETWIGHPEYGELHPTMQEMVLRTPSNREGDPRMSKTAENAAPQVDLVHMPEKVDTLRNETMCPLCFAPGTLVRAKQGYVPIETIEVGDEVLTHNGTYHKVKNLMENQYDGILVEINAGPFIEPVRATPDHPFKVLYGHHSALKKDRCRPSVCEKNVSFQENHCLDWACADHLTTDNYLVGVSPTTNFDLTHIEVPERFRGRQVKGSSRFARKGPHRFELTEEFLWIVGFYIAEGNSHSRELQFSTHIDEVDFRDRVRTFFEHLGFNTRETYRNNGAWIFVHSSLLAEWFASWIGEGCAHKTIPSELLNLPTEKLMHVIQGIFDGDGTKKSGVLKQTSSQLALQLAEYGLRAGKTPTISIERPKNKKTTYRTCNFGVIGSESKPRVKYGGRQWEFDGQKLYRVSEVSRIPYWGPVYNLEVEGDHTYVVQNILVHNCGSDMDEGNCKICGYTAPPEGLNNPDLTKANPDLHQNDAVELPQPDQQQQQPPPMNGMPSGGLPPNGQGQGGSMGNPMTSSFGVIYSAIGEMGGDEGYSMEEEPSENWQGLMQWVRNPESEYLLDDIVTHRAELNEVIDLLANFNIMPTPQNKQRFMQIAESAYGDIDPRDREQSDLVLPWGEEGNEYFRNAPPDLEDPRGGFGRQGKFGVIYIDNNLLTNEKRATGPNFQGGRVNTNEKPLLPLKRVVSDRPKNQKTVSDPPRPVVSKTDKETH